MLWWKRIWIKRNIWFKRYKNKENILKILLNEMINNFHYIFCEYNSLLSLPDISKLKSNNISSLTWMFCGCNLLKSLPDEISELDITNVVNLMVYFLIVNHFLLYMIF